MLAPRDTQKNAIAPLNAPLAPLSDVSPRGLSAAELLGVVSENEPSDDSTADAFGSPGPRIGYAVVRVAALMALLYVTLFNLSVVRGSSMAPGIHDGDRILVEPWSYLFGSVERGDVIVLRYPLDPAVDYIKRVVGLPGDRVEVFDDRVWVNGSALDEPYVAFMGSGEYTACIVPDGHYFVLGDNRPKSSDSRDFGVVARELVRGRVDVRLWPLGRVGWID